MQKEFWNERYRQSQYIYGETPNLFFQEWLSPLPVGSLLLPAEGEGRNGVFAATLGWMVEAFDLSEAGREKALALAAKKGVNIHYQVGELSEFSFEPASFDAIGLIFAHFPAPLRRSYHRRLLEFLKPGGILILEAFSQDHLRYQALNPKIGGPRDLQLLYSLDEIREDFVDLHLLHLLETEAELSEGDHHSGIGKVVRMVGRKG